MLAYIESAVQATAVLRQTIHDGDKIISMEILWECLVDTNDENSLFKFLSSPSEWSQREYDAATPRIPRMIELKTNLLRHMLALVSDSKCMETGVTKNRFLHCLRHSCRLMDSIPPFRCAMLAQNESVS